MKKSRLDRLFKPEAIAIVGASASPEKAGYMALKLLDTYQGRIYPVNPNEKTILGHKVYTSLKAIGEAVDLVILAIPATACPALLREAASINAGAALIMGGGFAESGEDGRLIQEEIKNICKTTGIRLLGPNTGGFADPINKLVASFSVSFAKIPPGSIAIISQSGGISLILACMLENDGFGISLTAGLGNCVDIDGADMIDYLADDDATKVIMLYMEGLSDGRRLYEAVRRATLKKPLVALTIGRSDIGEFAKSHTGNLVGSYALKAAALKQAGAVVVETSNDLVDAACAFSLIRLRPAANPGIGMLVGQAGAGLLMFDQLKEAGVNIPALSKSSVAKIARYLPPMHFISNPVDVGRRTQEEFANILRVMVEDKSLSAILAYGLYEPTALDPIKLFRELDFKLSKPVIYGTAGESTDMRSTCAQLAAMNVAPFKSPERSARAMQALVEDAKNQYRIGRYGKQKSKSVTIGKLPPGALDEAQGKRILKKIKIPVPRSIICHNRSEAKKAYAKLRKPVTVKILSAAILHKTEVGGVHLNIRDRKQFKAALKSIDKIPCPGQRAYLVEEMAGPGLDLIVGGLRDAVFGPTVLLGMGGTMAEALKDVSMRLAPLQPADAEEMIAELKASVLFDGWRGSPAINRQAVIDALLAVSDLLISNDQIQELDINPLRANNKGVLALDALIVKSEK
ncbi:MAG: acyl-CoA synthetase [Gammaproteobacteria bacterium]|nr:acyl-CoA synthetase [Gammaproteobacteria bacterium]